MANDGRLVHNGHGYDGTLTLTDETELVSPTRNFVCLLEETARRHPERPALLCDDATLSHGRLHALAGGFARDLAEDGVEPGARVAVVLPNHWTFAVAILGIWKLGATAVPLSPLLKPEEQEAILADVDPAAIVRRVESRAGDWVTAAECAAPALIGYSSGSTGRPKGAVFSHAALTFADRSWAEMMAVTPEDVVLSVLPLPHSFGLHGSLLAPLLMGAQVVLSGGFSPEPVLRAMDERGVTLFLGVATMFQRLLSAPEFPGTDLSTLRLSVSGAAPCPWELAAEWRRRTGRRILRGYGMTELFRPISYLAAEDDDRPESIGRAVPGVEAKVVTEGSAGSGEDGAGELWIRTPAALQGYWNDSLARADGRLVPHWGSGPDRRWRLRGNYRPPERAHSPGRLLGLSAGSGAVLAGHPDIAEAAVVGVPHADLGEEVAAFVVLKPEASAAAEGIVGYCQNRLARFKYPRHIRFVPELPKGPTGKVLKVELLQGWRYGKEEGEEP